MLFWFFTKTIKMFFIFFVALIIIEFLDQVIGYALSPLNEIELSVLDFEVSNVSNYIAK